MLRKEAIQLQLSSEPQNLYTYLFIKAVIVQTVYFTVMYRVPQHEFNAENNKSVKDYPSITELSTDTIKPNDKLTLDMFPIIGTYQIRNSMRIKVDKESITLFGFSVANDVTTNSISDIVNGKSQFEWIGGIPSRGV